MKNTSHFLRLGMTASELVAEIARINSIDYLSATIFLPDFTLKERVDKVKTLLFHRPVSKIVKMRGSEVSVQNIQRIIRFLEPEQVLGVVSSVEVRGGKYHIPLMDFNCEISEENLKQLRNFLTAIYQGRGAILVSGRSYHYYGMEILTKEEWLKFLGQCLLLTGYTDARYIGHCLIRGYCTLRISANRLWPQVPKVVTIL